MRKQPRGSGRTVWAGSSVGVQQAAKHAELLRDQAGLNDSPQGEIPGALANEHVRKRMLRAKQGAGSDSRRRGDGAMPGREQAAARKRGGGGPGRKQRVVRDGSNPVEHGARQPKRPKRHGLKPMAQAGGSSPAGKRFGGQGSSAGFAREIGAAGEPGGGAIHSRISPKPYVKS